jgi:hypothetical protein
MDHFIRVQGFATSFGVLFNFYRHDPRSPIKSDPNSKLILTLVGTISIGTIAGAGKLHYSIGADMRTKRKNPDVKSSSSTSGFLLGCQEARNKTPIDVIRSPYLHP